MPICQKCDTGFDLEENTCPKCGAPADSIGSSREDTILGIAELLCWLSVIWIIVVGIIACFSNTSASFAIIQTPNEQWIMLLGNIMGTALYSIFMIALAIVFKRVRLQTNSFNKNLFNKSTS